MAHYSEFRYKIKVYVSRSMVIHCIQQTVINAIIRDMESRVQLESESESLHP